MLKAKRIRPQQKQNYLIIQNGFGFLNKYRLLSQGSSLNFWRNVFYESSHWSQSTNFRKHQDFLVCPSMKGSSTQSQNSNSFESLGLQF